MEHVDLCPKCGSNAIVRSGRLETSGASGAIRVGVDADPAAPFFQETEWTGVRACICARCGFVELYAADPAPLHQAHVRAESRPKPGS